MSEFVIFINNYNINWLNIMSVINNICSALIVVVIRVINPLMGGGVHGWSCMGHIHVRSKPHYFKSSSSYFKESSMYRVRTSQKKNSKFSWVQQLDARVEASFMMWRSCSHLELVFCAIFDPLRYIVYNIVKRMRYHTQHNSRWLQDHLFSLTF